MVARLAPAAAACPSCRAPMDAQSVASHHGSTLELDVCHACHGIWFDSNENLRMSPAGVVDLFGQLYAHRDDPHTPLARSMTCPRCRRTLIEGVDIVKSGRYITYRCPERHGRFSTFASFFIEKGFVRQLTMPEIADLTARVRIIHCTSCGAPVDLRKDHACPYCRAAFCLLDPQAVERALTQFGQKIQRAGQQPCPSDVADALIAIERDRERTKRQAQQENLSRSSMIDGCAGDLWSAGLAMVWQVLNR